MCMYVYMYVYMYVCDFSFRSDEWTKISKKDREKLGIKVEDDGEFW